MITAAVSAMANIAEGFDSGSDAEFARFLRISQRSATEFQSHLYVAADRAYLQPEGFRHLYAAASELKRLVGGFIQHLAKTPTRPPTKDQGPGTLDFQCDSL
jgi:four helix bundle protein